MQQEKTLSIGQALDLGVQLAMAGRYPEAIGLFRGVLAHEPENVEAMTRLGAALTEMGDYFEALYLFGRALRSDGKNPMHLTNYGQILGQLGHPNEAVPYLERAIANAERNRDCAPAAKAVYYNNLGNTLERLGRHKEALPVLEKGIRYNPQDGFPLYNKGIVLLRLNRHREAIEVLDRCIALDPNDAEAYYNRGMGRLLLGDLNGGFADYEYRLVTRENKQPNFGLPAAKKWDGKTDLTGKTVLVYCEQGLGDDIQFFRFIPALEATGCLTIKLVTHSATRPLIEGRFAGEVLDPGAPLGDYDYWVGLMSLPHLLGISKVSQIPPPFVIPVDLDRAEQWGIVRTGRFNVGVVWAGNWQHKNDRHRSIPLATFATLFNAPGVNFVSLQQLRPGEEEEFAALKEKYPNLSAVKLDDFRDTAAAIANLDCVVSVDTAVAHLAASRGGDTRILIPAFGTDWRWQASGERTAWYPHARLHRQFKIGDWTGVLKALRDDLTQAAASIEKAA